MKTVQDDLKEITERFEHNLDSVFFNTLYQAFTKWSSSVKALGMGRLAPNYGQTIYLSCQWNKLIDSLRSRKADTWWILENLFNVWSSVIVIHRHLQSFQRQALQQVGETLEQVVWFNWKGLVLFCILPIFHYDHQLGILHSSLRGINSNIVSLFFPARKEMGSSNKAKLLTKSNFGN